ncbi:MAG: hypothetical protein ACOC29_02675 [Candidatus Sumerlaeota bacterium]
MTRKFTITMLLVLGTILGSISGWAAEAEDLWREAAEAYQAGDYQAALDAYSSLLGHAERPSEQLLYNMGNANYQIDRKGRAAWFYERALQRNPRMADARSNLGIVRAQTGAPSEAEAFFLWRPFEMLAGWLAPGEWALVLAVTWSVAFILAALYMIWSDGPGRRTIKRIALALAVLCLFAAAFAVPRIIMDSRRELGVILQPGVVVRSAPSLSAEEYFQAVEGERMAVTSSAIEGWLGVKRLADGRKGFVRQDVVGRF